MNLFSLFNGITLVSFLLYKLSIFYSFSLLNDNDDLDLCLNYYELFKKDTSKGIFSIAYDGLD